MCYMKGGLAQLCVCQFCADFSLSLLLRADAHCYIQIGMWYCKMAFVMGLIIDKLNGLFEAEKEIE